MQPLEITGWKPSGCAFPRRKLFSVITSDGESEKTTLSGVGALFGIMKRQHYEQIWLHSAHTRHACKINTSTALSLAVTWGFVFLGALPATPVLWSHPLSPQPFMKYDVLIQRPVRWYDPGKCEVTLLSPKRNMNLDDFQRAKVQSKAGPCSGRISTS